MDIFMLLLKGGESALSGFMLAVKTEMLPRAQQARQDEHWLCAVVATACVVLNPT
jgi:hypothetical protein